MHVVCTLDQHHGALDLVDPRGSWGCYVEGAAAVGVDGDLWRVAWCVVAVGVRLVDGLRMRLSLVCDWSLTRVVIS